MEDRGVRTPDRRWRRRTEDLERKGIVCVMSTTHQPEAGNVNRLEILRHDKLRAYQKPDIHPPQGHTSSITPDTRYDWEPGDTGGIDACYCPPSLSPSVASQSSAST